MSTADDPYAERKKLTFEEAEGLVPLPSQLALCEISQQFRAVLWNSLNRTFKSHRGQSAYGSAYIREPWSRILNDVRVYRYHRTDPFPVGFDKPIAEVKQVITEGTWSDVLGWLEFVLKHPACPSDFAKRVDTIMEYCRSDCNHGVPMFASTPHKSDHGHVHH